MRNFRKIIFNDTELGSTEGVVTFERETDLQKEYRITDIKRSLTASFFSEYEINFIKNDNFLIEIL